MGTIAIPILIAKLSLLLGVPWERYGRVMVSIVHQPDASMSGMARYCQNGQRLDPVSLEYDI